MAIPIYTVLPYCVIYHLHVHVSSAFDPFTHGVYMYIYYSRDTVKWTKTDDVDVTTNTSYGVVSQEPVHEYEEVDVTHMISMETNAAYGTSS